MTTIKFDGYSSKLHKVLTFSIAISPTFVAATAHIEKNPWRQRPFRTTLSLSEKSFGINRNMEGLTDNNLPGKWTFSSTFLTSNVIKHNYMIKNAGMKFITNWRANGNHDNHRDQDT